MHKGTCNANSKLSNDVIHLRRNADRPKCKINYGLRRKSTLIDQNQHRRNSPTIYTIREDNQTTWLSNETETIGIEKKYINEMDININNFFKIKPIESNEQNTEIEANLSEETIKNMEGVSQSDVLSEETIKPMERFSVSDVCKVLELQSGLRTANNVKNCLIDVSPDVTYSEMTKQNNPRRKIKSIEKIFGNDNVNEIDFDQIKKLYRSRRTPATLVSGRVIKRGLIEMPIKKRNSPRQIFFAKNQQMDKKKIEVDSKVKSFNEKDHKLMHTIADRQLKSLDKLKQNIEEVNRLSEKLTKKREFTSMNQALNKGKVTKENRCKEIDIKVILKDGYYPYKQTKARKSEAIAGIIDDTKLKIENSFCGVKNDFYSASPYISTAVSAIKEKSDINLEQKVEQMKPLEIPTKETCPMKNYKKSSTLQESEFSRPFAVIKPKYSAKNSSNYPTQKRTYRKYYVAYQKIKFPLPKTAKILEEPEKAQMIDVNLGNSVCSKSDDLTRLIPYNMEPNMDMNIDRKSAMRTTVLVERAQHLHQEYEKRLLIDKYLETMPKELNEVEAEFAKTLCVFPKNRIQEIDRCPCGVRLNHCRAIMFRPTWYYETDSLTKWLLSTPPAVIISIFIICIFSICVLNSENPKPMTTWEYMMSSFKNEFKKPTRTFRSKFF